MPHGREQILDHFNAMWTTHIENRKVARQNSFLISGHRTIDPDLIDSRTSTGLAYQRFLANLLGLHGDIYALNQHLKDTRNAISDEIHQRVMKRMRRARRMRAGGVDF